MNSKNAYEQRLDKGRLKTWKEYKKLPNKDKLEYITGILGSAEIHGVVYDVKEQGKGEQLHVILYSPDGTHADILKDQPRFWGLLTEKTERNIISKDQNIGIGDLIKGELQLGEQGSPCIVKVQKLLPRKDFINKLSETLKKKWQREGFEFYPSEFSRFNGEIAFDEWVLTKVEAMLEDRYETFIQEKMREQEKKLYELKDESARLRKQNDELKSEVQKQQDELNLRKERIIEAEKDYRHYLELGIISEKKVQTDDREHYAYSTYAQLTEDVWGYLWKKKGLYYERLTVTHFMNALRTQQLILLWGRPGTGKTSMPLAAAEALGAECKRIQVQSNWTENQDLLGYYNIVDKRYVPTQFLDALAEAAEKPEKLYLILLDEMNLSNVEYYFSEMLNVFTWEEDKPYTLHLYSERLKKNAKRDLDQLKKKGKDVSELIKILADMDDYKPDFQIPKNVRFVGTLNTDATTKTISPKVIDRSCLIELQTISRETKEREKKALPENNALDIEGLKVRAGRFIRGLGIPDKDMFRPIPAERSGENLIRPVIDQIREITRDTKLSISNRIDTYIDQWTGWNDSNVKPDEVVLEKILPLIDMEWNKKNQNVIEGLRDVFIGSDCEKSLDKLKKMEEQANENKTQITYWED